MTCEPPAEMVEDLAADLDEANPESEFKLQPIPIKLDIARECLRLTARAQTRGGPCGSIPLFITGSDAAEAAQNDFASMWFANPKWAILNRDATDGKGSDEWYKKFDPCKPSITGKACHEFPFFSTAHGGEHALPFPALNMIDGAQNSLQGTRLNRMYHWCDMQPVAAQSDGSPGKGDAFVDIPLPPSLGLLDVPTTWLCNGKDR